MDSAALSLIEVALIATGVVLIGAGFLMVLMEKGGASGRSATRTKLADFWTAVL